MDDEEIRTLKQQVSETRAQRLSAQRKASQLPTVAKAAERLERDTSSGITLAITEARKEIQELILKIMDCAQGNDYTRSLMDRADKAYPGNTQRSSLVKLLDQETQWRQSINAAAAAGELDFTLPLTKEGK